MALKFQFQFAGADFSRPSSPYRKWLRIGLMSLMFVASALAYWGYLHHLTHGSRPVVAHVVPSVATPSTPKVDLPDSIKPATPTPTPSLKKIADDSLLAVGNYLIRAA